MLKSVVFFALLSTTKLFAHPMKMAKITGNNLELKTIGHSFAGSIKDRIVMGYKKQGKFVSELKVISDDQETVSQFSSMEDSQFGGELLLEDKEKHQIKFLELNREESRYVMSFDGTKVSVFVKADRFEQGHFMNPEYVMEYKGKEVSFKLEGGEACYGYSLHLITMIMGLLVF